MECSVLSGIARIREERPEEGNVGGKCRITDGKGEISTS